MRCVRFRRRIRRRCCRRDGGPAADRSAPRSSLPMACRSRRRPVSACQQITRSLRSSARDSARWLRRRRSTRAGGRDAAARRRQRERCPSAGPTRGLRPAGAAQDVAAASGRTRDSTRRLETTHASTLHSLCAAICGGMPGEIALTGGFPRHLRRAAGGEQHVASSRTRIGARRPAPRRARHETRSGASMTRRRPHESRPLVQRRDPRAARPKPNRVTLPEWQHR